MRFECAEKGVAVRFVRSRKLVQAHDNVGGFVDELKKYEPRNFTDEEKERMLPIKNLS